MAHLPKILKGLGSVIVGSIVLIALSLLYFLVTAWIVSFGVEQATGSAPSPDFVALSAAILTFGGLAGGSVRAMVPGDSNTPRDESDSYEVA